MLLIGPPKPLLPDLIRDVEGTVRSVRTGNNAPARREALRVAADLYGLLRSDDRRTGRPDLSSWSRPCPARGRGRR
ncbi:hypothetical protein SMICM17S_09072 [Streptomyces microflavus]